MNEQEKTDKPTILDKLKENKKLSYVLAGVIILLVVFIVFGGVFNTSETGKSADAVDAYVDDMEERLTKLLSSVKGVGKVSVAISVESGMQTVLASKITTTETSNGKETIETPIVINGKTVVIKELYPEISGVLIVAEGANNISVRTKIQQATTSLLNINLNRVEILTMK